ncbi:ankyrin repeat-containing domain protein [Pelagophyceae sp. CCMP2097]|nr:ankyrin repeat-containing domain protein [Pelagophyceae sp. CCMP2097]
MAAGADVTLAQATTATTPLMFAAREGHADALRFLLKFDQNVDAGDEHGATALALAALECRADIARALIDYDADPYHADGAGNTVFHVGAFYCSEEMRAGPQAGAGADGRGRAFALALLDAKVRGGLDSLSQTGRAPLHLAAKANAKSYAHALRAAGADARLPSPADGATPAALARAGGFQSLADELVAPPRADDEEL